MTLRGPHVPIYWMRFIAPPPAWKKKTATLLALKIVGRI